jgi:hypothetical protein
MIDLQIERVLMCVMCGFCCIMLCKWVVYCELHFTILDCLTAYNYFVNFRACISSDVKFSAVGPAIPFGIFFFLNRNTTIFHALYLKLWNLWFTENVLKTWNPMQQ